MGDLQISLTNTVYVQFADFDGSENMIADVPVRFLPQAGDALNIRNDNMTYFLEVEGITHFVDCDLDEGQRHSVTIDCKMLQSRPATRLGALK
jgi:hypothetical protein